MADQLISVIMPTFRAEDTISRAVSSILAQAWRNLELVIVSDDGQDYERLLGDAHGITDQRIRQVATGGVKTGDWNARNMGLAASAADLVTIIDSDDAYAPNRLQAMAPMALRDGAALDDTQILLGQDTVATLLHEEERVLGAAVIANAALILRDRVPVFPMWRRSTFDGVWRQLPHASDVVFSLELLSAVPTMRVAANPGYHYFKRAGSMTMSDSMTARSRAAYLSIIGAIAAGDYVLSRAVADVALYEIAKNLNQAAPFGAALAENPRLTHEMLAMQFNQTPMTEAERFAFFSRKTP
jgi:succinoglycan biosynthesis protein ExoO